MSTTLTTTQLGTSNLRGSSSKTRNLPSRTSRNVRPNLRQNSLLSNPASVQGAPPPEPLTYYPAITHFTDAITALPRDFRRHTSLLKEVDAKAWALEENVQKLLKECLHERQTHPVNATAQTIADSTSSVAGDVTVGSTADSVAGNVLDTASQYSGMTGVEADTMRRRRLYAELRNNLMQMMMPLDEKNHVINNANDELSRQTRRQDAIWMWMPAEFSEDVRQGSLKHWALTDLNPTKKTQAATARARDLAIAADNEVAERSERRREAMALAKKQKTAQPLDSDAENRKVSRKEKSSRKLQEVEDAIANIPVNIIGNISGMKVSKSRLATKKVIGESTKKPGTLAPVEPGGTAMSRENSQQEPSKKRKAPVPAISVARKRYPTNFHCSDVANSACRINAATQESPKLAYSSLAGTVSKEAHKKSPALANARPVTGRGRQASAQSGEPSNRHQPAASRRNGVTATSSELERVATATGKTINEVKQTMKETINSKGQKVLEEDIPDSVDNRIRGGIALERSASKSSQLKKEAQRDEASGRRTASPRLHAAAPVEASKKEKNGKAKANKTSTPTVSTFAEAEASESAAEATSTAENGSDAAQVLKRPVRPRIKDHHGLHDSLSPKGLPTKRTHKKHGSYSITSSFSQPRSVKEEEVLSVERKPATSRANSRSVKNNSITEPGREVRNASPIPKIGASATEFVDEPDSLPSANSDDANMFANEKPTSRRQSHLPKNANTNTSTSTLDVKPPGLNNARTTAATTALHTATSAASPAPTHKADTPKSISTGTPLGSPGPEEDMADADGELEPEEEEEEDPNEQRYCYCNGVSYGEMVACDNENCAREWFHLECTGLRALPPARSTWYCDECKGTMAR